MSDTLFDLAAYAQGKTPLRETFKTKKQVALNIAQALKKLRWPDNYFIVDQKEVGLEDIGRTIAKTGRIIFDLETSGLDAWRNDALCISIYTGGKAFLVSFGHKMMKNLHPDDFRKVLKPYFVDPDIERINHNIKFDAHFVEERLRCPVGDLFYDSMLAAWVIDPSSDHGLKELVESYALAETGGNFSKQFGKHSWAYIDPRLAAYYACKDVELVHLLMQKQTALLERKPRLKKLFWEVEMPVLNILYDAERQGVMVDDEYVDKVLRPRVYTEYGAAVDEMRPFVEPYLSDYERGTSVSDVLESTKKLFQLMFERRGIPEIRGVTLKKTTKKDRKTGVKTEVIVRTLDKNAIAYLKGKYPEIKGLGGYRKVATVKKMFVDKLPELVTDHLIHPNMNGIGAETGRMSYSDPNLQQIPSRMGPLVRNMFVPRYGNVFCSMDFSGQEMRIQAHFSRPPKAPPGWTGKLVEFYLNEPNLDIYSQTAIDVLPPEDFDKFDRKGLTPAAFAKMSKDERKKTMVYAIFKSLVLGLGYGMGPRKFARQVEIPEKEAVRLYDLYFATYPELKAYQERCIKFAEQHGYIVTLLGRERPLPFINSHDKKWKGQDERASMNTPIQGTAADQVKLAMIKSTALIKKHGWPVRIALVVHDEIIFEMNGEWAKNNRPCIEAIRDALTTALPLIVPMKSSISIEPRWGTEIDLDRLEALENFEDLEAA